jgi:hypothetical protein
MFLREVGEDGALVLEHEGRTYRSHLDDWRFDADVRGDEVADRLVSPPLTAEPDEAVADDAPPVTTFGIAIHGTEPLSQRLHYLYRRARGTGHRRALGEVEGHAERNGGVLLLTATGAVAAPGPPPPAPVPDGPPPGTPVDGPPRRVA